MVDPFAWLIPLAPLAAAIIAGGISFVGVRRGGHYLVIGAILISALMTAGILFSNSNGEARIIPGYRWLSIGSFAVDVALRIDPLTLSLLPIVTGVSLIVAAYSVGYMTTDRGFSRYFAVFAGFVFSMTMLVLANNLLLLYAFWEGVGLCSYLLIGFWYQRPTAAAAATKAFLVNRVADAGFLVGILLLWRTMASVRPTADGAAGLLDFSNIFEASGDLSHQFPITTTLIGFLLLLGAIGKSAQFPLHVWLPDAMEGPTPVSALIHAATMVTAGVYLLARMSPLLIHTPAVLITAALLGAITAIMGALLALTQHDLKRILAYSTVSQLGYMFMALGAGIEVHLLGPAVAAAMFHLITHAFFKALLFLAAGNVMHAMGDVIDLRRIGGLGRVLPTTRWYFLIGAMALAGLPPLAGFWSKDTVLAVISDATHGPSGIIYRLIFPVAIIASFLTALYSCRAYLATFHGNETIPPEAGHHPHEAHPTMLAVMGLLALGSISAGFALGWPHAVERFLGQMPIFESEHPHAEPWSIMILSTIISLTGIGTAFATGSLLPMAPQPSSLWFQAQNMGLRRLFIDEVYGRFIVGPVKAIAGALSIFDSQIVDGLARLIATMPAMLGHIGRRLQTGMIASYAFMMLAGIVVVLYWISNGTR